MEIIVSFFASVMLFTASLLGLHTVPAVVTDYNAAAHSVEFGLSEMSPSGENGGFAMPASGCSPVNPAGHNPAIPVHDCATLPTITATPAIVRFGENVTVTWDPKVAQRSCTLSATVLKLVDATGVPNAAVSGSRIDADLTGQTTYSIVCEQGKRAEVTVKVLPRIQET